MLAALAVIGECALVRHGGRMSERVRQDARAPAGRIGLERGLKPWRRLARAADSPSVGLTLVSGTGITAVHHLGVAFTSAPHLLGALQVFVRYFPYLCQVEHLFEYSFDGHTAIGWDEAADVAPHSLRDYVLAQLVRALGEYAWQPVTPLWAELNGPSGADAQDYREAFGCPVYPGAPRSRIVFDTARLAVPMRGSNPELHRQVSLRLAADEVDSASTTRRVVGALEQLLDRNESELEGVARYLGLSVRALQYRLQREGCRYSDLLRRVRQRRAIYLLCETSAPIGSIAYALGYRDAGSFQRAFRGWFGSCPVDFRHRHCDL